MLGVGLCHGISGNAYVFMRLYEITLDSMHLNRAWKFVQFSSVSAATTQLYRQPDVPYSLMNGISGGICFWSDVQQLTAHGAPASFPAFDA